MPLDLATDGIVCLRPVVPETEMEFEWCDEASQALHLSQVNAGLFRETQMVDFSFQRNFGALLPPDATLLHAYKCANDVPGKGLREGVLFVTDNTDMLVFQVRNNRFFRARWYTQGCSGLGRVRVLNCRSG